MRTAAVIFAEVDEVREGSKSFTLAEIDSVLSELCEYRSTFPSVDERIDWLLSYRILKESG